MTEAVAKQVVDTFEKVNNRANKTRDEDLLATVESGQVREQSKADYATLKIWLKDEQKAYGTANTVGHRNSSACQENSPPSQVPGPSPWA